MNLRKLVLLAGAYVMAAWPVHAGVIYEYDAAGRVKKATYTNGVVIEYRYDSAGNRRQIVTNELPNQAPVARNDTASVVAPGWVDIQVRNNDSDPEGHSFTVTGVSSASAGGTVGIRDGGAFVRYTASGGAGTKTFTYMITDSRGGVASATVTVNVQPEPNSPPSASNDSLSLTAGTSAAVMALANDTDPNGDTLTITGVSTPTGGSASVANGGSYIVYNGPSAAGSYTFTYSISDGRGGTASATVYVAVTATPNRTPIAQSDAASTTTGARLAVMVLSNDSDPDSDPLSITSVSTPSGGSASVGGNGSYINYTAPGTAGTYTFNYTVADGRGGSASSNVTISVSQGNRPPVAVADSTSVRRGVTKVIDVLANDSDPDGNPLTIISVTQPDSGTATITNNGTRISFVGPSTGFQSMTYTISDGQGGTASTMLRVNVTGGTID